jgi:GT2 family glycosyltransferase
MADISVVVVQYRTREHVLALLAGLGAEPEAAPQQVLVVDNEGYDAPFEARVLAAGAEYLPMQHNVGFAAAVNAGAQRARCPQMLLLNPDARPEPGCIAGLLAELAGDPDAVVAGPRLLPFGEGKPEVPSATRLDPGLVSTLLEYTVAWRLFPGCRSWLHRHYFADSRSSQASAAVAMVQGACLMVRRDRFLELGGFDAQRFFLYFEETDFCRRVRATGGSVRYVPGLACRHLGGASLSGPEEGIRHFWRSFHAYFAKHHGMVFSCGLRALLILGVGAEWLVLATLGRWRGGRDLRVLADAERARLHWRAQFQNSAP